MRQNAHLFEGKVSQLELWTVPASSEIEGYQTDKLETAKLARSRFNCGIVGTSSARQTDRLVRS